MKRFICCMLALLLCPGAAWAETDAAAIAVIPAAPEATAAPEGETFSSEDIIITLPYGLELLSGDDLAAYEAAVQDDFPGAGRTLLAAVSADAERALVLSVRESELSALDFAREAAQIVLGSGDSAVETSFGENSCAAFSCGIGEQVYQLYFMKGESGMLIIGASGLTAAENEAMLGGLIF